MKQKHLGIIFAILGGMSILLGIAALSIKVINPEIFGSKSGGFSIFNEYLSKLGSKISTWRYIIITFGIGAIVFGLMSVILSFLMIRESEYPIVMFAGIAFTILALGLSAVAVIFNSNLNDLDWLIENGYQIR